MECMPPAYLIASPMSVHSSLHGTEGVLSAVGDIEEAVFVLLFFVDL